MNLAKREKKPIESKLTMRVDEENLILMTALMNSRAAQIFSGSHAFNSKLEIGLNTEGIPSFRSLRRPLTTFVELRRCPPQASKPVNVRASELWGRGQTSLEGPETWYTFRF